MKINRLRFKKRRQNLGLAICDPVALGHKLSLSPIIARQDWVAVLNPQGAIVGYVQGDGF
jgi:hypothetical protein